MNTKSAGVLSLVFWKRTSLPCDRITPQPVATCNLQVSKRLYKADLMLAERSLSDAAGCL